MTRLETQIIDALAHEPTNPATTLHPVDQVDLPTGEFSVAEFDNALESLQVEDVIRMRNPSAPEHVVDVQYLGGDPEVDPNG